jgi:hypothetical protein
MTGLKLRIFDRRLEAWQRGKRVRGFPLSKGGRIVRDVFTRIPMRLRDRERTENDTIYPAG